MVDDTRPRTPFTRPARTRFALPALTLGVVLLAGAGCGGDETDAAPDPSSSVATEATSSASTPSPSPTASSSAASPSASGSASASPTPEATTEPEPVRVEGVGDALDADFPALAPSSLPVGWALVDSGYDPAGGGTWTLSLTDADGAPVALTQRAAPYAAVLASTLGDGARPTGKVDLATYGLGTWRAYDSPAIARRFSSTSVVIQAASQASATSLAQELLTAEDGDLPTAG